ncbi:helix-turn-helix domain-containing protein [Paenibacillus sp. PDC88]|uniref:helix-turn-helix domain-containing protein n=1 Tax=Paenibacillus sp. PDC88 TaxID=1884375 RepID=UPI0008999E58|nr:helix-turn-helix transcriptional regulator [Paenibacillus sp. PDC88]SDW24265.1 DNA-binding transcriptional regulator, XRE-family HTH domain [Paenibacillus sp. PDC88]
MPYSEILALNIKKYRELRGLEQQALADTINVTKQALNNYETKRRKVPVDLVPLIADALSVSIETLYGRSDESEQV